MTPEEISRMVEYAEADAWADFFLAAPEDFRAEHGLQIERAFGSTILFSQSFDDSFFNRVLGLGLSEPLYEGLIDDLMSYYLHQGRQSFCFPLSPLAQPPVVHDWLAWRGFQAGPWWPKLFRPAEPLAAPKNNLRIEPVTVQHAWIFAEVSCAAFGMSEAAWPWFAAAIDRPGWFHYLAWADDQPAASGAMYIRGDVAWLGMGSTLPGFRRRGAQAALVARRIQDGIERGCRWFVTDTADDHPERPNPSYRNMRRAGFEVAYYRPTYRFHAPEWG